MSLSDLSNHNLDRMDVEDLNSELKNALIMMVDDEPILMEVLQSFLEDEGYHNIIMVDDSSIAMDTLRENQVDIVLLDLKMPVVSGLDILQMIRGDNLFKRLPVIVLTSERSAETKLKALELGATDFLAKPVDPSELVLRLRNTLTVKAYQDQLTYYDAVTGLPNSLKMLEILDWSINQAARREETIAVMNVAVTRFKHVYATLGTKAGDEILHKIAARLTDAIRVNDGAARQGREMPWQKIARLSDNEFFIVLPGGKTKDEAAHIARRVIEAMKEPFKVDRHHFSIDASIGVAVYPVDGEDIESLFKNSSAAARYAAGRGRYRYQFYSAEIHKLAAERLNTENELRRAIVNREFVLHYQPKLALDTLQTTGMEALIRWQHPERG